MHPGAAQLLLLLPVSNTTGGSQLQPAPNWAFLGENEHFAALIKRFHLCVCALKTDILVGGSLLRQLSLII